MIRKFLSLALFLTASLTSATERKQSRTIDDIYKYALTDIERTRQLVAELRKKKQTPQHEINLIEGDVQFNRSYYYMALNFYKRAFYDKGIKDNTEWMKMLLIRIIPCYENIHDMKSMEYFSKELLRLATQTNDAENMAMATFSLGIVAREQDNPDHGYRLMRRAIRLLHDSDLADRDMLLFSYQMKLIEYFQDDMRNEEQQDVLSELKKLQETTHDKQLFVGQRLKDVYAHETVLAYRMGRYEEAEALYEKFKNTGNGYQYDYKCIEPYLKATARYDEMILFSQQRIDYLYRIGITTSLPMTFTYRLLADGYMGKGNFRKAAENYKKLSSLKRDIINEGEKGSIEELTSVYELKDLELKLKEQIDEERLMFVVTVTSVVVSSLAFLYYRALKHSLKMKQKNRKLAAMLDDSLQKKKEIRARKTMISFTTNETDADKELFDNVWNELIEQKLYLNPALTRETLLQKFHIPKNRFSSLFSKYAGMSYSQCINTLRLEYAVELLQQHPNYTVEWVAEECGMTSATLYRLFSQKYGMTPAEYREAKRADAEAQSQS